MGIGSFAQNGQFGKFSTDELLYLKDISGQGFESTISKLYPGIDKYFKKDVSEDDTRSIDATESINRGPNFDSFVNNIARDRMGVLEGPNRLESLLDIPRAMSSGLRPSGGPRIQERGQHEFNRFEYKDQFNPDGSLRTLDEIAAIQRGKGYGGFGDVLKGETPFGEYAADKIIEGGKGIGRQAATTAANIATGGIGGHVASLLFPDIFGRPPVFKVAGAVVDKVGNLLFGKPDEELESGEDPGGIWPGGREPIENAIQKLQDITGYTAASDLVVKAADIAEAFGGDIADKAKELIFDALNIDQETGDVNNREPGPLNKQEQAIFDAAGVTTATHRITGSVQALMNFVNDVGDVSDFTSPDKNPFPGSSSFIGPVQQHTQEWFDEDLSNEVRDALGITPLQSLGFGLIPYDDIVEGGQMNDLASYMDAPTVHDLQIYKGF